MKIKDKTPDNIWSLKPYTSARDLANNHINIFLDANESPFESGLNRYPDPGQRLLTDKIAEVKNIESENILLTNGSDEGIDLLIRSFCAPGNDKALIFPPTYGIYEVRLQINHVAIVESPLDSAFEINALEISMLIKDPDLKLIIICSPNNPTGHIFNDSWIIALTKKFHGIVIVDEAYIDFSPKKSLSGYVNDHPNLVVLQTLSKAWGMASARIGITIANNEVITILRKIKLPYNISGSLQEEVTAILKKPMTISKNIELIIRYRDDLVHEIQKLKWVVRVFPSQTNFLLVKLKNANKVFNTLVAKGIQVRNFSSKIPNCLRISVGTKKENKILIQSLEEIML